MTVFNEPGLCGLELWRGIARGEPLHTLRDRRSEYFPALIEFILQVHAGTAEADDARETTLLRRAAGFSQVVLCGGDALDPLLRKALLTRELPFAVELDCNGPLSARRGALRLFARMGWERGLALDLGQLQLKVMAARHEAVLARDTSWLPLGANSLEEITARERLRAWIRTGLVRAADWGDMLGGPPDGVVLALPVALDRDGIAEAATYPGLFGPVQPIFAGLFACPCVVVNDAVLAAFGFQPKAGEKTLVVTLGFGVGGALWD